MKYRVTAWGAETAPKIINETFDALPPDLNEYMFYSVDKIDEAIPRDVILSRIARDWPTVCAE